MSEQETETLEYVIKQRDALKERVEELNQRIERLVNERPDVVRVKKAYLADLLSIKFAVKDLLNDVTICAKDVVAVRKVAKILSLYESTEGDGYDKNNAT